MQIIYEQNPLATKIILDDHEKKELWWKIKVGILEDLLYDAYFTLARSQDAFFNRLGKTEEARMDDALRNLDPAYYLDGEQANAGDKTPIDIRTDLLFNYFIEELQNEHVGDCTCVPATCDKCSAESKLGINTTDGLDKHAGHAVSSAFKLHKTLDEVIHYFKTSEITASWGKSEDWAEHIPRWTAERQRALSWLTEYKEKTF